VRYPERIHIREVTPRDGLQAEALTLDVQDRIALIDMLSAAGFPQVNAVSFVSARTVPQMANAAEVMAGVARGAVVLDATVPNVIGVRHAIEAQVDEVSVFVSASDASSKANVQRSTAESMSEAERVVAIARQAGLGVIGTISAAFGSPYGDQVAENLVLDLAERFVRAGVNGLALGDTTGEGTPRTVASLVGLLLDKYPDVKLSLHLHDTRGLAVANSLAAMDAGATRFDSAIGGLGGSPFTRNSSGNLATEELLFMCRELDVETGVGLNSAIAINQWLEGKLGHPLPAKIGRLDR
jgi:hydroxymethylglutaryl-CoA lyase